MKVTASTAEFDVVAVVEGFVVVLEAKSGSKRWYCTRCGATNQGSLLPSTPITEAIRLARGHYKRSKECRD